jgi:hypothetical protein
MINRVEAHGIVYEIKTRKKVNWCVLAEWTIRDQLCILQFLKATLSDKFGPIIDLNNFVD